MPGDERPAEGGKPGAPGPADLQGDGAAGGPSSGPGSAPLAGLASGAEAAATPPAGAEASSAPPAEGGQAPARRKGRRRKDRPHPYAGEASPQREMDMDARKVTVVWLGLATAMVLAGLWAQGTYGYVSSDDTIHPDWEEWTWVPLFGGLALLGFGFRRELWTKRLTMAGWILFAFYWALTAKDLLIREGQDYVNYTFALVGVYFFTYLAYHNWLTLVRGVENRAVHFLNVSTFVAAGAYFLIDKVQWLRLNLIYVVSDHTKWMLDLFGQGDKAGLVFLVDEADNKSPTTFFYPDQYCSPTRTDKVGEYCAENGYGYVTTYPPEPTNWFEALLQWAPAGEDLQIVPVSIILACTALQSIMLFVGLIVGTDAPWKSKLKASLVVGAIVYVLNLVRNTGIIWFYGQGHASFWVMHNAIGKGGSLVAMILIAFGIFRYFPQFFDALVGVLDLPERDGPVERTLRLGRKRPTLVELPPAAPPG